jgi:hypothetical protein
MIGELSSRQILALSNEGCAADVISKELKIEESLVRLVLSAHKGGSQDDRDINDAQLALLRSRALGLALGAEDETVAAKMTMFLIERDRPRKVEHTGPNIGQINMAISVAREKFLELSDKYR